MTQSVAFFLNKYSSIGPLFKSKAPQRRSVTTQEKSPLVSHRLIDKIEVGSSAVADGVVCLCTLSANSELGGKRLDDREAVTPVRTSPPDRWARRDGPLHSHGAAAARLFLGRLRCAGLCDAGGIVRPARHGNVMIPFALGPLRQRWRRRAFVGVQQVGRKAGDGCESGERDWKRQDIFFATPHNL